MLKSFADSDRVNQTVPSSNPGSDDPSGGIATGSGGVSSAAYVLSPVPNEQKSVVQSVQSTVGTAVETVYSYLPSLASLSLGGGKTEEQETKSAGGEQEAAVAGGAAAAAAAAAAASTAAATTERDAVPTDSTDQSASATAKDVTMADSDPKEDVTKSDTAHEEAKALDYEKSSDVTNTDTANEEAKALDQEKSSDVTNIDKPKEESIVKEDTEAPAPGVGNEGSEVKKPEGDSGDSEQKKPTGAKENRDAIPTAGGERLGDKHWGESKVVPDAPPKRESEGGPQVSSSEGQPDSMLIHSIFSPCFDRS